LAARGGVLERSQLRLLALVLARQREPPQRRPLKLRGALTAGRSSVGSSRVSRHGRA